MIDWASSAKPVVVLLRTVDNRRPLPKKLPLPPQEVVTVVYAEEIHLFFIVEVVHCVGFCRRKAPRAFQCTEFDSQVGLVSLSVERDFQGDYQTGW